MAGAIFPLDTSQPWTYNNVTYEYDEAEDKWSVVSTNAVDTIVDDIGENKDQIDAANEKNNQQDAAIHELDNRIDAVAANVGSLSFKGRYKYATEKSKDACDLQLAENISNGMPQYDAMRIHTDCIIALDDPFEKGTFTSIATVNQIDIEELVISTTDLDGLTFDWDNLVKPGDYIEFIENEGLDSVLYEVIDEQVRSETEGRIRVKHVKSGGLGDGDFALDEISEVRVIKKSQGLNIEEADERYTTEFYVDNYVEMKLSNYTTLDYLNRQGYATEDYVKREINKIDIPDPPDMSDYLKTRGGTITGVLDFSHGKLSDKSEQFKIYPSSGYQEFATNFYSLNGGQMRFRTSHTGSINDRKGSHIVLDANNGSPETKIYKVVKPTSNDMPVPKGYWAENTPGTEIRPPGLRFKYQEGSGSVSAGKFMWYGDSGQKLKISATGADFAWGTDSPTGDISFSESHLFHIYALTGSSFAWRVKVTGSLNRIDWHNNDILLYVPYNLKNGNFSTDADYYITIAGLF